jgi:hypothetical protein
MEAIPRRLVALVLALGVMIVIGAAISGCADPRPPTGRWEGLYEDAGVIIAARLEIAESGTICVSAPNAVRCHWPSAWDSSSSSKHESPRPGRLLSRCRSNSTAASFANPVTWHRNCNGIPTASG